MAIGFIIGTLGVMFGGGFVTGKWWGRTKAEKELRKEEVTVPTANSSESPATAAATAATAATNAPATGVLEPADPIKPSAPPPPPANPASLTKGVYPTV